MGRTRVWAAFVVAAGALAVPAPGAGAEATAPMVVALMRDDAGSRIVVGRLGGPLRTVRSATRIECPAVSPGGGRIAFNETAPTGRRIGVMRVDGSGLRWLTAPSDRVEPCNFVWSPGGHRLYYGDLYQRTQATYWIRTDGTGGRVRIPSSEGAQPVSIRSDGRVLAVTAYSPTARYDRTELLRVDGSVRRVLTPDNYAFGVYSSDDRYLATIRILELDFEAGHATRVYLVNPVTKGIRGLTATGSATTSGISRPLSWTPDGRAFYYARYADGPDWWVGTRLYRIGADGTGNTEVAQPWPAGHLAWVSIPRP